MKRSPKVRAFGAALLGIVLASCQTTPQFGAIKTAIQGQTIFLTHAANLNPDCSSLGEVVVRVVGQPAHGQVSIRSGSGYSAFPAANPRSRCNTRQTPGVNVSYTPGNGYTGPDSVALEVIFVNGQSITEHFDVTVK